MHKGKPTAILTADLHITDQTPVCRTDDYRAAFEKKLTWLHNLANTHDIPIIDAGDTFDHWKPSPELLAWAFTHCPGAAEMGGCERYTVPGNHDLPQHNLGLLAKSGLHVLHTVGHSIVLERPVKVGSTFALYPFPWGVKPVPLTQDMKFNASRHVAVAHVMTYKGRKPYPTCSELGASLLLSKLDGYDLVVTGHNHKSFVAEVDGRLLVNPGSLMRATADQMGHVPGVWIWFAESNTVDFVEAPHTPAAECMTRVHLEKEIDRDDRVSAFVEVVAQAGQMSLSFETNIEAALGQYATEHPENAPDVSTAVWAAVGGKV